MGNKTSYISYIPKYKTTKFEKKIPGKYLYNIYSNKVFWRGQKINADGNTFKNLGFGYGKDQYNTYWKGQRIKLSDKEKLFLKKRNNFSLYVDK